MPHISEFRGIEIYRYYNDHRPPHFHAQNGDDEAIFDINTLGVMEGSLPRWALKLIQQWASHYRQELLNDGQLARARETLEKIDPLP